MEEVCCVCGETLGYNNTAECSMCGALYHLSWSTKDKKYECGGYCLHETVGALVFLCRNCGGVADPTQG